MRNMKGLVADPEGVSDASGNVLVLSIDGQRLRPARVRVASLTPLCDRRLLVVQQSSLIATPHLHGGVIRPTLTFITFDGSIGLESNHDLISLDSLLTKTLTIQCCD